MRISLIIPMYNERGGIAELWRRLKEVIHSMANIQFEVVFVDDGSSDGTSEEIASVCSGSGTHWEVIKLSRNFGHQAAITAGMASARGDAMIFLDADLQDPPELIPAFVAEFQNGADVVYGVRKNRKEAWWLRLCFGAFYRILNSVAERPVPLDAGDFSLISRRVAKLLSQMPEQDRLIRGLRSWVGFRQVGVPYDRPERFTGETKYRLWRRVEGALDGLFSFTRLPVRFGAILGACVVLIGATYLASAHINAVFFGGEAVPGWTSLITLGFILGGANIIFLAIVGEYVCRIYFQAKARPLYIVDAVFSESGKTQTPEKTAAHGGTQGLNAKVCQATQELPQG
jgi:dolichol-phosphate mannosyltransferase